MRRHPSLIKYYILFALIAIAVIFITANTMPIPSYDYALYIIFFGVLWYLISKSRIGYWSAFTSLIVFSMAMCLESAIQRNGGIATILFFPLSSVILLGLYQRSTINDDPKNPT